MRHQALAVVPRERTRSFPSRTTEKRDPGALSVRKRVGRAPRPLASQRLECQCLKELSASGPVIRTTPSPKIEKKCGLSCRGSIPPKTPLDSETLIVYYD